MTGHQPPRRPIMKMFSSKNAIIKPIHENLVPIASVGTDCSCENGDCGLLTWGLWFLNMLTVIGSK